MNVLGTHMLSRGRAVRPADFPDETFELYSIPAHDRGGPELTCGADIGSNKQCVEPGDVLISKIIPHIRRVQVVGPWRGKRQIASSEWIIFRTEAYDPTYLRHFLLSDRFHQQFMNTVAGVGGSLVRARPQFVKAIPAPLPPLDEQRRIAAILDQADAIRTKRRQVLTQLDSMVAVTFRERFGSPVRDARWPRRAIGEFAETRLGKMLDKKKQNVGVPSPYLRNVNVQWFRIELHDLLEMTFTEREREILELRNGDVLMCEGGEPGRCAIWRAPLTGCYYQKALHRIRLSDEVLPEYFVHCMRLMAQEGGLRDYVTSATIAHLTGEKLRTVAVPVPPLAEQEAFRDVLSEVGRLKTAALGALAKDDELFASLQARAFRGEL